MSNNYELLKSILGRNGLDSPDGRQLCLYRSTEEEYLLLRDQLLDAVEIYHKLPNTNNLLAACFCLYASEWWRKNYESGPWSWSEVLESINLGRDSNLLSLYPLINIGLAYWKRRVLTVGAKNVYLVTLACEGGLPLKLLSSQKDVHLQKYFRALLREFQVYGLNAASSTELAARVGWLLPPSLQHEVVFQISGSLIERIWELQSQLGQTQTPIEDLDKSDPGWRDKLPLVVSDETARTLLNNLVKAANILAARATQVIKVAGVLKRIPGGGFQLTREIQLPASMNAMILAEFLAIAPREVPCRFQIVATDARGGRHHVSLVTRRTAGDEGRFAFEFAKGKKFELTDDLALLNLKIEAVSGKDTFTVRNVVGGDALSSLPWVFVAKRGESEPLEFVGEGGVKTCYPAAYVAIHERTTFEAEADGIAEKIGDLPLAKRALLKVSGSVKFRTVDNITKVRTATVQDESSQYFLEGALLSIGCNSKERVFSGFPNLIVCSETGCRRNIGAREIQYKVRGSNKPWSAITDTSLGPLSIRHIVEGETRFLADIDIVPAAGGFKFFPGVNSRMGRIQMTGFRARDVGIVPVSGLTSSIQAVPFSDELWVDLCAEGEPPALVRVCLRWTPEQELTVSVPFPTRGGRFLGRDGNVLQNGETVHIDRLGGVVAQVFALNGKSFSVTASLTARDISPELASSLWIEERLSEVSPGRNEIDLRSIQEGCNLLFSMTADLDATIKVGIVTDACQVLPRDLKIARYDAMFEPDRKTGEVVLPAAGLEHLGDVAETLRLEAFPLWAPQAKPEELSRNGKGKWRFSREERALGPWLITGWEGEWCRIRPFLWTVFEPPTSDAVPAIDSSNEPVGLEAVVRMGTFAERKAACKALVALLASDPNHPDWAKVDAYLGYLQYLPATTFDVIERLARNPDAAALCLMRSRADSFDTVWTSMERLPFSWALISISSWVKAARLQRQSLLSALTPIIETLGQDLETFIGPAFQTFFDQAPVRLPGLQAVVELIQYLDFNKPLGDCQYLRMVSTSQGRQILKQHVMDEAHQILLQSHANDQWPELPGPEEAILGQACVDDAFKDLWYRQDLHFRHPVLNAPVAAAMAAVCGIKLSREHIFHFRKLREFDIPWFDAAFACSLSVSIGYLIENDKGFWA